MLPKWLMTSKVLLRLGVALARLIEAGLRLRTSGRAATTKGRIWSRMIGVLGMASALTAALAAGMAAAAGKRLWAVGPSSLANDSTWPSVVVAWLRVPGRSTSARLMLLSSEAKA